MDIAEAKVFIAVNNNDEVEGIPALKTEAANVSPKSPKFQSWMWRSREVTSQWDSEEGTSIQGTI